MNNSLKEMPLEYKPLDLKLILKTAASIVGVPVSKIKKGRVIGNSELTLKINLAIEIYVKYIFDNSIEKIDHSLIVSTYNGYLTKIITLKNKFKTKGISKKTEYYYNELCKQMELHEKK
jgi:hypothetical protein